jgi:hypothetical protein
MGKRVLHIVTRCDTKQECVECCSEIIQVIRDKTGKGYVFLLFMDWTQIKTANLSCVPHIVKFMKENKELNRASILGTAIVMASKSMRTMLNMCFAIQKPVTEIKMFKAQPLAYQYIETKLPHVQ